MERVIQDAKYADIEYACGIAEGRVQSVENELADYKKQVEYLSEKLSKLEPGTKNYNSLKSEYEEALDDQRNLECYVELVKKERDKLQAELRRIINEH